MNREEHHREHLKITDAFKRTDENFRNIDIHVGEQLKRIMGLSKSADKMYMNQLTSQMLWDCLMTLLLKKGILLPGEFDEALKVLAEATQKAMQEEAQKKAEASAAPPPPSPVGSPAPAVV